MLDTVYLHITKACNLRCVYCYFSAGDPIENELSTAEMLTVLEDVQLLNPNRVVITGGEPLLRSDILEIAQKLKKMNNRARLCITTNGTLMNEKSAECLVKIFDEIRISVDCFQEINDSKRGQGTFEKVMRAFRYVLEAGGNPAAFITVTSLNLPYLTDFIKFLLRNEICKIHLSPLKKAGRAKDIAMFCDQKEVQEVAARFWFENFGLQLVNESKSEFNCGVGKYLTVYPDGSVYPCHLLAYPEFCIGDVRKQRLNFIYKNSRLMNKLRSLHFKEISQCSACFKDISQEKTCLGKFAQNRSFREELLNQLGEKNASD